MPDIENIQNQQASMLATFADATSLRVVGVFFCVCQNRKVKLQPLPVHVMFRREIFGITCLLRSPVTMKPMIPRLKTTLHVLPAENSCCGCFQVTAPCLSGRTAWNSVFSFLWPWDYVYIGRGRMVDESPTEIDACRAQQNSKQDRV